MVVWRGLTNSWEEKRSERQRRKEKIYLFECRVPKNSKDKKVFLSEQCKEIEENKTMGKTRDLFKKIRYIKGIFHAKTGTIKDRNSKDLTEWSSVKKRWQEYTEELYKKGLSDPDNHDGVVSHLKPYILECEVKWALGSITMNKARGGDGIPDELFQTIKDDAVKVLHSIVQQTRKTQLWPQHWKRSVFIPIPKTGNTKECSNNGTIVLISNASKVMLKILQVRLQWYVNQELPDVQVGSRKGTGTRDQIANICWITEKAREFQENICFTDYTKAFDCVDHNKKILQEMEYHSEGQSWCVVVHYVTKNWIQLSDWTTTTYLSPEKPVCRSRSNS